MQLALGTGGVISGGRGSTKSQATDLRVDAFQIHEVRTGEEAVLCKNFKASADYAAVSPDLAIVILYGAEFTKKQLCLVAPNTNVFGAWTGELLKFVLYDIPRMTSAMINRALIQRLVPVLDIKGQWDLKAVKNLMKLLQRKSSTREIKMIHDAIGATGSSMSIGAVYRMVIESKEECDAISASMKTANPNSLTVKEVSGFFKATGTPIKDAMAQAIIDTYTPGASRSGSVRSKGGTPNKGLTVQSLVTFLHSRENSVWNPAQNDVTQDMTKPLPHYFMESSHNTYLLGDQFKSESSVEAYHVALRQGCRCIEIDTWDGPNGDPIVFHGRTLTSKIKFRDVLPAVREAAFWQSDFPLILSIEDHCSVEQQDVMAELFVSVFGECLITAPLVDREDKYPSPDKLRGRIIIKHKKLGGAGAAIEKSHTSSKDADLSASIICGELFVLDRLDDRWDKCMFALTETKLFYSTGQHEEADVDAKDDADTTEGFKELAGLEFEGLHIYEPWYHGKVKGGHKTAETMIMDFVRRPENVTGGKQGTFLVRDSDSTPGEFSLSYWLDGVAKPVQHARLRKTPEHEGSRFYLVANGVEFDTLFECVNYYGIEPIISGGSEVRLLNPVPQPPEYESMEWFFTGITRAQAEERLSKVSHNGAYLVRHSSGSGFAITFRADKRVKHCRVEQEGRMFVIGDADFPTLTELIEYLQSPANPLLGKTYLRYIATDAFLKKSAEQGLAEESMYGGIDMYGGGGASGELYEAPNMVAGGGSVGRAVPEDQYTVPAHLRNAIEAMTVKGSSNMQNRRVTLAAYTAEDAQGLSFPRGAVISNVQENDDGWSTGDYNGAIGKRFPSRLVESISEEVERLGEEAKVDADEVLGELEQHSFSTRGLKLDLGKTSGPAGKHGFRLSNAENKFVDVCASDPLQIPAWSDAVQKAKAAFDERDKGVAAKARKSKIAASLSDLIFYSQSVPWNSFKANCALPYNCMSSFNEKTAIDLACKGGGKTAGELNAYNMKQLSRVYPKGARVDSSNYDPQPLWNAGCQMVALNYQTPDKPMWLNHGFFEQNGGCGMVLKPPDMLAKGFNPYHSDKFKMKEGCLLKIRILSGRHFIAKKAKHPSVFVALDISGVPIDSGRKFKTRPVEGNGLNPVWDETVEVDIVVPSLATIGFIVYDMDMFGEPCAVAQRFLPIGTKTNPALRTGWRSVPLWNTSSCDTMNSSLLINFQIEYGVTKKKQALLIEQGKLKEAQLDLMKRIAVADKSGKAAASLEDELQKITHKLGDIGAKFR